MKSNGHNAAGRSLLNAHAAMLERVEAALSEAGLPALAWYDVLWALYRADDRRLRAGELSESVVTISRSGLTRLVDRMVDAGLIERALGNLAAYPDQTKAIRAVAAAGVA